MKKNVLFFLMLLFACTQLSAQKEIIINTTGYGFDRTTANGVADNQWAYIQKFANLTYNGQDASVTAVRFHVSWDQYEPTAGNYQGTKLAQAVAAILALKPNMKIALHFHYLRPGPQPGQTSEGFLAEDEISRIYDGTKGQQQISYTLPSIYSTSARTKFYNFVSDALSHLTAYYPRILYTEMGNGSSEEFLMPIHEVNGTQYPAFYEDAALQAWRTEYLPCRYPGQSTVTWNGNTQTIASASSYFPGPSYSWDTEQGREYHRFGAWGLMKFYKGFRDIVKSKSSSLKVLYFIAYFGTFPGNVLTMHNSTIPMAIDEFDGVYHSDGTNIYDSWKKIMGLDVLKGTNPNKIAAVEFDAEDLGEQQRPRVSGINTAFATEWLSRSYKHGADYVHLAMWFDDDEINQLAPALAAIRANFANGTYNAPARQAAVAENIYPNVFTSTSVFEGTWNNQGGGNWSTTDLSPKSVSISDAGYWQNIWSCTPANPCDFNVTASGPSGNVNPGTSVTLSSTCSGQCTGVTYSWSGNGINGTNANITFNAPTTAGTYTYTITAAKGGCTSKTATVSITVPAPNCDFNITATASNATPAAGSAVTLNSSCSGTNCSGLTYAWSGNGISGSGSSVSFNAPATAGTYTYTLTTSKASCANKISSVSFTVPPTGGACSFTDKATIGTWNGLNVQTRQYTVNGSLGWMIVTAEAGSSIDKHFPRGKNFVERTDISWSNGAPAKSCFAGAETAWDGLVMPSGITVPTGYTQGAQPDGAIYFAQSGCSTPSAPGLSASPSSITSGGSSVLSASGCSGGTINWSNSLGAGTSKTVSPTVTTTYTATCTVGGCTSSAASVTVTVIQPSGGPNCGTLASNVDGVSCMFIEGWIYDQSSPNTVVNVDIYDGSTLVLANVPANKFRQDLVNAGMGNGVHGLEVSTPLQFRDGQSHTVVIKASGCSSYQFNSSPRTLSSCSSSRMAGPVKVGVPATDADFKLVVTPNPGKGYFQARFTLATGKNAVLTVTDAFGKNVITRTVKGGGAHKEVILLTGHAAGTYFVQLRTNAGIEVKKIVLIR